MRGIVEPIVVAEGLELVVLQLVRSQQRDVLRLSVDRPGAGVTPGKGVSMAELEHLNRMLGDLLDVEDAERKVFREQWDLEVGSPGVDRPLTRRSHFKDVVGCKLKVRLKLEKKSILGRLESADDAGVVVDGTRIAFADLDHAHVVYEFAPPQKPGKAARNTARDQQKADKVAADKVAAEATPKTQKSKKPKPPKA